MQEIQFQDPADEVLVHRLLVVLGLLYKGNHTAAARDLGVATSTVGNWLTGVEMKVRVLRKLYNRGVSIDWLLDPNKSNPSTMFADSEAGRALMATVFGVIEGSGEMSKPYERLDSEPSVPTGRGERQSTKPKRKSKT